MTSYDKAPQEVIELINKTIDDFYPELKEAGVTVEALFAFSETADYPVKFGGYPALAYIKISNLKSRVKGMADAEITIDKGAYEAMNPMQQRALLDHELHHLIVARDKDGNIKIDDCSRPKLKVKKHDYQMGWFREIAVRHGENSPEVYQAKLLWNNDGKTFFPAAK